MFGGPWSGSFSSKLYLSTGPKCITLGYTAGEVQGLIAPLQPRIAELEARLKSCKV